MNTPRKRQFVDLCVQKQEEPAQAKLAQAERAKAERAKAELAKVRLNKQRPTNKGQAET